MNRRRLEKAAREKAKLNSGLMDRGYHSGSYHRHFEGYKEYETLNSKGKTVLRRVYAGEWYVLDLDKSRRAALAAARAALWLTAAVLFVLGATRPIASNSAWYGAIAELAVLWGLVWTAAGTVSAFTAPEKMTIGEWKSSSGGIKRGSAFSALALELTAFLTLLGCLLGGGWSGKTLAALLSFALAGCAMVLLNRLEANAPYVTLPNDNDIPPEAVDIG